MARWTDPRTGRRRQVSFGRLGITSRDAREAWAERKARALMDVRRARAAGEEAANMDLAELLEGVLAVLVRQLRPRTVDSYRRAVEEPLAWAAERGLSRSQSLTPEELASFRDWLLTQRKKLVPLGLAHRGAFRPGKSLLSSGGVNVLLRSLRAVLVRAARRKTIPATAREVLDALRTVPADRPEIHVLAAGEVRRVLEAAIEDENPDVPRFTAAILLGGFRFAELAALESSAVNLDTGAIRLTASGTKGRAPRAIDLRISPTFGPMLRRGAGPCFHRFTKDRARQALRRLNRRAGIRFSWHDLRRTCGSFLACAPFAGAYVAAGRLGHGVAVAERHYLRRVRVPQDARNLEAATGAEDLFERIATGPAGKVIALAAD